MRWLESNTDSLDLSLSKLPEIVQDRKTGPGVPSMALEKIAAGLTAAIEAL